MSGGVRRARPADLDRVVPLWLALTAHHAEREPRFALRSDAEPEVRRLLAALLREPAAAWFVWDDGRALVGLCGVRVERAPPIHAEQERAEITDLFVVPERRRAGLGAALLAAALDWLRERDVRRVEARVSPQNPEGQAFWRAAGFGDSMDVLDRRL